MRLILLSFALIRYCNGERLSSPLRRRDRKLDTFLEGATVSGTYTYSYEVPQQEAVTASPTPSPVVTPSSSNPQTGVPVSPVTSQPTVGLGPMAPPIGSMTGVPVSPVTSQPTVGLGPMAPPTGSMPVLPTFGGTPTSSPVSTTTSLPTYGQASSKSDAIFKILKGEKLPKTRAPLPYKTLLPKGTKGPKRVPPSTVTPPHLSRPPVVPKGTPLPKETPPPKGTPPPKDSSSTSKDGPPGGPSKGGPEESNEYESALLADYQGGVAQRLPVAAFLYVTASSGRPRESDYEELASQTKMLFDAIYQEQYAGKPESVYMGVEIAEYSILASRLLKYDVDVYFKEDHAVPSSFEVQSVAQGGLNVNGDYISLYMNLLKEMSSGIFSTTTSFLFINNASALVAAQEEAQQNDRSGITVAEIVIPVVLCFVMIAGVMYYQLYYKRKHKRTLIIEENDAIEVKRDSVNGDYKMANSTFHSQSHDESDDSCASSSYEEVEIVEDSDFEEITLDGEEEVDLKQQVGEIKKSYVATNIAEVKLRKQAPGGSSSATSSSNSTGSDEQPITAYAVAAQSVLNPLGHPYSASFAKSSGAAGSVPLISGSSVQVLSSRPTSPPPIWTNPNLRPVKPKEEQSRDIRELAKKCEDDKSVITIDSQSSSTPEFLKKFKQMGLAANPRTISEPERRPMVEDEKSILTIDSQASATPEFLKKFKQMGLKRYKE